MTITEETYGTGREAFAALVKMAQVVVHDPRFSECTCQLASLTDSGPVQLLQTIDAKYLVENEAKVQNELIGDGKM